MTKTVPAEFCEATDHLLTVSHNLLACVTGSSTAGGELTPAQLLGLHEGFAEFHKTIRAIPAIAHATIIARFEASGIVPALQCLRAHFEFERERNWASEIIDAIDPKAELAANIESNRYWALTPDLRESLAGCRRVAFAGSGPMPLSALCIAGDLGIETTCIEVDPAAYEIGKRIVELSMVAPLVTCCLSDIRVAPDLGRFDAIIGAVLLGVDRKREAGHDKAGAVRQLDRAASATSRLIFREPHGLGVLLYPAVDETIFLSRRVRRILPCTSPSEPYRSGLLIAA